MFRSFQGLDHLHEAKFSEAKGYTLVSNGESTFIRIKNTCLSAVRVCRVGKRWRGGDADRQTVLHTKCKQQYHAESGDNGEPIKNSSPLLCGTGNDSGETGSCSLRST